MVVGRASDFFGPRVNLSAVGERLFAPLLQGKAAYVLGDPDMLHSYTYMADVGKALVILGEHDEALGQPWHIPNPRTVTTREFVQLACDTAGVVPKLQGTPRWFANVLSIFMPPMRGIGENYYMFTEPYIVDASKFTNAFGDIATPLEQALEATMRWYKDHLGL